VGKRASLSRLIKTCDRESHLGRRDLGATRKISEPIANSIHLKDTMRKLSHRRSRGMKGRAHEPGQPDPPAEIVELADARARERANLMVVPTPTIRPPRTATGSLKVKSRPTVGIFLPWKPTSDGSASATDNRTRADHATNSRRFFIRYSAFSVRRSAFDVRRSALDARRSAFGRIF